MQQTALSDMAKHYRPEEFGKIPCICMERNHLPNISVFLDSRLVASPYASSGLGSRAVARNDRAKIISTAAREGPLFHHGQPLKREWSTPPDTRPFKAGCLFSVQGRRGTEARQGFRASGLHQRL
jgi:hypothetical protein